MNPHAPTDTEVELKQVKELLSQAADYICEIEGAPSADWWKRYFLYTGDHMILTEEGWEHGSGKQSYIEQAEDDECDVSEFIRDEVNAPVA